MGKFGNSFYKLRKASKISQEELAGISGINRKSISRIENGLIEKPDIDTLIKLSYGLDKDLVDLYIKDKYQSHYIYRDLIASFDLFCGFKPKEEIILLEKKLEILENDPNFKNKDYELKLMRLFIKNLKLPICINLSEEFESITSTRIKKNNLLSKEHSFIETRLLINICSQRDSFKGIASRDILKNIISTTENPLLKLLAYNSLINTLELEGENYQALNLMKEAIGYAKEEKYSEIFAFLYYLKFLCEHNLDMDDCERSLDLALIFADHTGIKNIGNLIRKNREII